MRAVLILVLFASTAHAAPTPATSTPAAKKPAAAKTRVEPRSKLVFIQLPGGTFRFGCEPGDACDQAHEPSSQQTVKSFWMGQTEVTAEAYARCVKGHGCADPDAGVPETCNYKRRPNHPMNCVDWMEAAKFCKWIGGRLPTATEWEYAAKGGQSRVYPWGNDPSLARRANFCDARCQNPERAADVDDGYAESAPVGSFPEGASPHGLLDMAGNVWEWTDTNGEDTDTKEVRGGAWDANGWVLRNSHKTYSRVTEPRLVFGFRCLM
jgi:formylglycine-generating enzyme required for sulfatase activity